MNRARWNGNEPDEVKRVDERIREELIRTAEPLPASYERRVRAVLEHLPDKKKCQKDRQKEQQWAFWKVAAVILVSVLSVSTGVTAGVKLYRQRLASMEPEKVEKLNSVTQKQQISADSYSRDLFETEEEKLIELRERYESEVFFPKAELRCVNTEEDVTSGVLCYCYENGTFYLPEQEMSEDELLQIVDFRYKRDYSLEKMQESEEKVADETEDEEVDISGTDDGEIVVEKSRKLLEDLYGWDTEGASSEVKSDGEYYNVAWKKSDWAYDVEMEFDIDAMELSYLSVGDEKRETKNYKIKIEDDEYGKYGEQIWKIGEKLTRKEERTKLWMGYHYMKESTPEFGVVKYFLMYKDKSGYIFKYSLNTKVVTEILYMANVKQVINAECDNKICKYKLNLIY